jgi:RNA-directed DNA polymerase
MFNMSRRDRWIFGDRDSGAYLLKHSWTKIVRHQLVDGTASPDDPNLTEYWARRRQRNPPPLGKVNLGLLKAQHGRCPRCGALLLAADYEPRSLPEWEQWLQVTRKAIRRQAIATTAGMATPDGSSAVQLVHTRCRPRQRPEPASEPNPATNDSTELA